MPRVPAAPRPGSRPQAKATLDFGALAADETEVLRVFWTQTVASGTGDDAPVSLYEHEVAHRLARARLTAEGGETAGPVAEGVHVAADAALIRLRNLGFLTSASRGWNTPRPALAAPAMAALPAAALRWWGEEGVLLPPAAARPVEEHSPAEVATSFARLLGTADGMALQASGRPGLRDQQTLLRCFAVSAMDADGGWTAGGAGEAEPGLWAAAPWPGYLPRLAPFVAVAAFEGLLLRGGRGWRTEVDAWLDRPVAEQWRRVAAGALRAAGASPLGRTALEAASAGWVSPGRLVDWVGRYTPRAGGLRGLLTVAVGAAAVSAGLGVLGRAGEEAVFTLSPAGRALLRGDAPDVAPPPAEPLRVLPDFTLLAPLADDPERAWALTGFTTLAKVDGAAVHRLERGAWTAARERGMDAADTVEYLREESGGALPQNVAFTLTHDWSDADSGASLQPASLLRFASAEAAGRARAAAPVRRATLEELTPTVWRIVPGREAAVRKALQALGVACGDLAADSTPEPGPDGAVGDGGRRKRGEGAGAAPRAPQPRPVCAPAPEDADEFRLPWPGPFGCPPPAPAAGTAAPAPAAPLPPAAATPARAVHMPPPALRRRLLSAVEAHATVWIETRAEGIVRFRPTEVTRGGLVTGECLGCGDTHFLEMEEIRGLVDAEAVAQHRTW